MKKISFSSALKEALFEELDRDKNVFLVGEDLGIYGGLFKVTEGLQDAFGKIRVLDSPISENSLVGMGIGAAITGLRPVVEILYIDFITLAMDQIVNQAAKYRYMTGNQFNVPMVIRTQMGVGRRNGAQHSQCLESWFVHVPGLKVVMPSCPYDAKGLLKSAIRDNEPVLFIEHKNLYFKKDTIPISEYTIPIGEASIKKEGEDVTIIATSWMVEKSLIAANELDKEGISIELIDPRTIKPLDVNTIITSIKKTKKVVIVQEACKTGGFGAELISIILENAYKYLDSSPLRVCGKDTPIPYAPNLEDQAIPQVSDIKEAVKSFYV